MNRPTMRQSAALALAAAVAVAGGATAVAVHKDREPSGPLPNHALTPGVVDPTLTAAYLCSHPTSQRRNVTAAMKRKVFAEYGIAYPTSPAQRGQWEVDHLVPLTLGGANDVKNLWPERAPGFHDKDKLELKLHELVCSKTHPLDLHTAQQAIITDWTAVARKYKVSGSSQDGEDPTP